MTEEKKCYCVYCNKELKDVSKLEEVEPFSGLRSPIDILSDWVWGDHKKLPEEKYYCCEECSKSIKEAKAKAIEVQRAKKEAEFEAELKFFHSFWVRIIFALYVIFISIFLYFWWWPHALQAYCRF
ncbi:hypothetical protein [Lactobacillus jensenii]|uniref:Uncharacterized protein n=1 Tax=Lactobacillus jensenii TaxID=109790 RepID=A0ABU9FIA9_LACJE|nr:hypothetical protein [Lactobacillus jensenii]MDT9545019.1 hypothetical protein [Lactobacillus jensenii]